MDCIRILTAIDEEKSVRELLTALESSPRLVAEMAFFTSYYHCPLPLAAIRDRAERLAGIFPQVRAAGYRVGINHLTTIGHHDENLKIVVDRTLPRQVGLDSQTCTGALCPADSRVREYVRQTYTVLASIHPDFIWVDDDVRLGFHMPTNGCCLCDACIGAFSKEAKEHFTRKSLVAAFDDSDFARRSRIRRLFIERNTRVIRDLLALIEQTVHGIDPKIELGQMTGEFFWDGYGFEQWAAALRGRGHLPVRWRPGGGFYGDERPRELLDKAHAIGRQVSVLPPFVSIIQSEIENFPYQPLRKAMQTNALEITADLLAGCTGTALNILGQQGNGLAESIPLLNHLKRNVPFWERLKTELRGSVPVGVWAAWDRLQIAAGRTGQRANVFADMDRDMNGPFVLAELGIPVCYRREHGCMTAMSGRMPHALGRKRMKELLAGGVLLDAEALRSIDEMGLAALAGVNLGKSHDWDTQEIFSDDPLNRGYTGWKRDCRQSFRGWNVTAHELLPLSRDTAVLARIADYQGRERGASLTAFENELGGRVAVMSYFPWTMNMGLAKRQQMVHLCEWLSGGKMPVTIETFARITPWVRRHPDGRMVIGMLNLSGDTYESVDFAVRTDRRTFQQLSMNGKCQRLPARKEGDSLRLSIRGFQPYTFEIVLCGGR